MVSRSDTCGLGLRCINLLVGYMVFDNATGEKDNRDKPNTYFNLTSHLISYRLKLFYRNPYPYSTLKIIINTIILLITDLIFKDFLIITSYRIIFNLFIIILIVSYEVISHDLFTIILSYIRLFIINYSIREICIFLRYHLCIHLKR